MQDEIKQLSQVPWDSLVAQLVKNPICNVGDPGSIPGSGRSAGEGIGYPLQYSWASLVAQLLTNPSAMQETNVQSLGREDPLEKGKATHSSILVWRIPWTRQSMGRKESDTTEHLSLSLRFLKGMHLLPSQNRITRGPEPLLKGLAQ